jgi:pimeloyl-ACP methyl ester carboxylesterase
VSGNVPELFGGRKAAARRDVSMKARLPPPRTKEAKEVMPRVISKDGSVIAFDTTGSGPPLILVDGALNDRSMGPNESLVPLLAQSFTVYGYDRRGRGESTDAKRAGDPYAPEREIEDLHALLQHAGGSAYMYGISSGAVLALDAAARLDGVKRLAVYEAPLIVDSTRPALSSDYATQMSSLVARDRLSDAIKLFLGTGVNLPAPVVFMLRLGPPWKKMKRVAHSLPYDVAVTIDLQGGKPLPRDRWADADMPTLAIRGSKSPDWMTHGMRDLAVVLPNARPRTLDGQSHIVKAKALAPVLIDFFQGVDDAAVSSRGDRDLRGRRAVR